MTLERLVVQIKYAMCATFAAAIARFGRNGRQRYRLDEAVFFSSAPAAAHGIMGP